MDNRHQSDSIALGIYNFGTRISSWRGGCDDFICRCCAPFYHFDGIHWQFYWLFFVIYLALHFPFKIEKTHHELDGYDVRYFHHIFGHYFWLARHVLFGQSSKKSFCSGCSCVNHPKIIRRSHLQFHRRIHQENFHFPTKKVNYSKSSAPRISLTMQG